MATYTCPRCAGTGRLTVFSNVLGGVCFKCHGAGTQRHKPPTPSAMWAVFGHDRHTGESRRLYNVRAKTEQAAIEKARSTMAGASALFKDVNTLARATAIKFEDMADPTAMTWEDATATTDPITAYYTDRANGAHAAKAP